MNTERGTVERWQHSKAEIRSIEMGTGGEDISDDQAERRALFNKVVRALESDAQPVLDAIEGKYSPRDLGALQDALTALVKFRS